MQLMGKVMTVGMAVLEYLTAFIRVTVLAVRLFANMLAGHTVLFMILFFIALVADPVVPDRRGAEGQEWLYWPVSLFSVLLVDRPEPAGAVHRRASGVHLHVPDGGVHRAGETPAALTGRHRRTEFTPTPTRTEDLDHATLAIPVARRSCVLVLPLAAAARVRGRRAGRPPVPAIGMGLSDRSASASGWADRLRRPERDRPPAGAGRGHPGGDVHPRRSGRRGRDHRLVLCLVDRLPVTPVGTSGTPSATGLATPTAIVRAGAAMRCSLLLLAAGRPAPAAAAVPAAEPAAAAARRARRPRAEEGRPRLPAASSGTTSASTR